MRLCLRLFRAAVLEAFGSLWDLDAASGFWPLRVWGIADAGRIPVWEAVCAAAASQPELCAEYHTGSGLFAGDGRFPKMRRHPPDYSGGYPDCRR